MTRTSFVALALALALATGCPAPPVECTEQAAASLNLTVVDPDGVPVADAQVNYTVDGGDPEACELLTDGGYVCGWEIAGAFDVQIGAVGYLPDTFSVTVDADECHVLPQVVTRTLTPMEVACTQQEVFGALVNVTDAQGVDITSATVAWGRPNAGGSRMPCEYVSGNQWACASEVFGLIEVSVTEAGAYEPFLQAVDIGYDGCDPVTETLDAVLAYLPD